MGCVEVACIAAGLVLCAHDSSVLVLNTTETGVFTVIYRKWSLSHTTLARQSAASAYLPQEVGVIPKLGSCSCLVSTLRKNAAGVNSIYKSYRAHTSILALTLPPGKNARLCAPNVSPGLGIRSTFRTRSALTDPTTTNGLFSLLLLAMTAVVCLARLQPVKAMSPRVTVQQAPALRHMDGSGRNETHCLCNCI
jgi:hypothetical protein